jgi:hypothetical protein
LHGKHVALLERFVAIVRTRARQQDRKLCLGQKLRTTLVGSQNPSELLTMTIAVSWLLITGKSFGSSANVSGLANAFLSAAPFSLGAPPATAL